MIEDILLVSKDALRADYLGCYGEKQIFPTHNIDKLSRSGTLFLNCYTAAPSSTMSYTCMFSGLNSFELNRKIYRKVKKFTQCSTLFTELEKKGLETHVIWPKGWEISAIPYTGIFSNNTKVNNLPIIQKITFHKTNKEKIKPALNVDPIGVILSKVREIINNRNKPIFLWVHCPQVFLGRTSYGSDIDLFDELIGELMDIFPREGIYLTGDHGHMNCEKGIPVYGFHVYEGAIRIPLITPRINGEKEISFATSNTQLLDIILNNQLEEKTYIYSDTMYYMQRNRKLAIIKGDFKYVYNKRKRSEELYDLKYDPGENVNLLIDNWYDENRGKFYNVNEIYYYPRWEKAKNIYDELKSEKNRIWREGLPHQELMYKLYEFKQNGLSNIYKYFPSKSTVTGRWGSVAQRTKYEE